MKERRADQSASKLQLEEARPPLRPSACGDGPAVRCRLLRGD